MNWTKFITYGDSPQNAFETLCNQLFERYLKRTYKTDLLKFRVINGAGGDGGIEAESPSEVEEARVSKLSSRGEWRWEVGLSLLETSRLEDHSSPPALLTFKLFVPAAQGKIKETPWRMRNLFRQS